MKKQYLTLMSYNIRCCHSDPNTIYSWDNRKELIKNNIDDIDPDIISFQEAEKNQIEFLNSHLKLYDSIVVYRDDTLTSEACPIYYKKDKFLLVGQSTFWLSETPEVSSRSWACAYPRIATIAEFKDLKTNNKFVIVSTHLSYCSVLARVNGLKLIIARLGDYPEKYKAILGDFNATSDSEEYRLMEKSMIDTGNDDKVTYNNYGKDEECRIDYCFISKEFVEESYEVVDKLYDSIYPSDHFPIVIKLSF